MNMRLLVALAFAIALSPWALAYGVFVYAERFAWHAATSRGDAHLQQLIEWHQQAQGSTNR